MTDRERQLAREADMMRNAAEEWCKDLDTYLPTDSKPVQKLVGISLGGMMDAVLEEQVELKSGERKKLPKYAVAFLSVRHPQLALITISTMVNMIRQSEWQTYMPPTVTNVAYEVGQWCRVERLHDLRRKRGVDIVEELMSRNRNRNAAKRAAELARKLDDEDDWAKNFRSYHLGARLIALAVKYAQVNGQPIFEFKRDSATESQGMKMTQRIELTEAAEQWIAEQTPDALDLFSPMFGPMIDPPQPWTALTGGGYLSTPLRLLKRQTGKRAQGYFELADLTIVFSAVNALQNTPYRINKDIDRIMREAFEAGLPLFRVKNRDSELTPEQAKSILKVMSFRLCQAAQLRDEARFYFPYQLDHRGRAYPVPQLMNPQSDHIGRSQLEFADGKALGERGVHWLAIHLANSYGKDKVSYDKRIAWVHENEEDIIAFAAHPLQPHRFWREADKFWLFLAACLEWKRYKEEGPGVISHLPVSMDGTCNGYQHLSAMGLDPIGGRATCLVPADEPGDIYQWVADLVSRRIDADAAFTGANGEAARQLLRRMNRHLAKDATMTTPYGVTRRTIYQNLLQEGAIKACKTPEKCALYLAQLLVECIREVAVEASRIMTFLRGSAAAIAEKNRGMVWITAAGFPVIHEARVPKAVRVVTADRTFVVYVHDEAQKIDVRKQIDGIVPHLVHSQDAAHMMLTVNRLYAEGLRHFAMVHDSYGVHAADVDLLQRVLREEFVRLYSEPVLQNFLAEQKKSHPDVMLPALPHPGTLDIRDVLSSPYFFA